MLLLVREEWLKRRTTTSWSSLVLEEMANKASIHKTIYKLHVIIILFGDNMKWYLQNFIQSSLDQS